MNIIIGITGPRGAGKTQLANFLIEFIPCAQVLKMSDYVRSEVKQLRELGIETNLSEHSFRQREAIGVEYWMFKILQDIRHRPAGVFIVDGLRNPVGDIDFLLERSDYRVVIVGITADEETRFRRVKERNREGNLTDEEIRRDLANDLCSGGEYGFDLPACLERCRGNVIMNSGTLAELESSARSLVESMVHGSDRR